ncbi:MAG: hypothetical protein OXI63_18790, partial [Candidatus Poribacteria bacterium]|nr:hypothetical protein [Candidatus Poribacteria bacterium]
MPWRAVAAVAGALGNRRRSSRPPPPTYPGRFEAYDQDPEGYEWLENANDKRNEDISIRHYKNNDYIDRISRHRDDVQFDRRARLGADISKELTRNSYREHIRQGQALGLTPQELWGTPSSAGASGGSSSSSTLGNNQAQAQAAQAQQDTQLKIAQLNANTNQQIARERNATDILGKEIETGTTRRGQDITDRNTQRGQDFGERQHQRSDRTTRRGQDNTRRTTQRGQGIVERVARDDRDMRNLINQRDNDVKSAIAKRTAELTEKQLKQKTREVDLAMEKWKTTKWQQEKAWILRQKLMTMGPENVLTLMITDYLESQGKWKPGQTYPDQDQINYVIDQMNKGRAAPYQKYSQMWELLR